MKSMIRQAVYPFIFILVCGLLPGKSVSQVKIQPQHGFRTNKKNYKVKNANKVELNKDTAHLESKYLKVVIANNEAYGEFHKKGYSGVSELYIKNQDGKNFFVPLYAGLNYEHIFSGDSATYDWNAYETRITPMKLVRLSDKKVELQQLRTKNWPLKSSISYELVGNSIDFVFSAKPLADIWTKNNYIGIFFASYINTPPLKGINFIGKLRTEGMHTKPSWIYHLPVVHGSSANHRPAGSHWDPSLDTSRFPISLVSGISDLEYSYPFYYGLSGDNVCIMMFQNPAKVSELRFAQSPDGGGDNNPAWDFIYYRKKYKIGKMFSFRARAVFKKFEGVEDVIKTYEAWSGEKVIRPVK
jgi:hypothetical protein